LKRLLLVVWLLAGVVLWTAPAAAHAVLQSASPADREVLAAAPAAIVLTFNEPVVPISAQVLDSNGRVVTRDGQASNTTLRIALPAGLPAGAYVASWRVTSADSHPIAGSLVFAVGAAPASWGTGISSPSTDGSWQTGFFVVRTALSVALILSAGGALALVFVRRSPGLHPLLSRLTWIAGGLALLVVGVQGAMLKDAPFIDLLRWSTWELGASTTRGISAAVAIGGLLVLLLGLRLAARPLLLLGALVALASVAFTGHTGTGSPRWLSAPLLALHAILVGFWIGSLIPLLHGFARSTETKRLVARFSMLAMIAVPILIFCGVALVFRHVTGWNELTETRYGILLLVKIALVVVLLAMAAINKWALTPRLPRSTAQLTSTIRLELLLGIAILAVTVLLSQTPPPASASAHEHGTGHLHGVMARLESGRYLAEIEVTPGAAGRNLILFRIELPNAPKEVTIELSQPDAGIEPIHRPMTDDNGTHVLEGPELAVSGRWRVRIDVLITDFDKAIFETEIPIQ